MASVLTRTCTENLVKLGELIIFFAASRQGLEWLEYNIVRDILLLREIVTTLQAIPPPPSCSSEMASAKSIAGPLGRCSAAARP